jgi:hypothetical protein
MRKTSGHQTITRQITTGTPRAQFNPAISLSRIIIADTMGKPTKTVNRIRRLH